MINFIIVIMPYLAAAAFAAGLLWRALHFAAMPHRISWNLYPAPERAVDRALFFATELLSFSSLRRNAPGMWMGAYPFHASLALFILWLAAAGAGAPLILLRIAGAAGGALMAGSALYLIAYRLRKPDMRAVSDFAVFFDLFIFIMIGGPLLALSAGPAAPLTLAAQYMADLVRLRPWATVPSPLFIWMLAWTELMLFYLPWSRMIHVISKYFAFRSVSWERKSGQ